MIRDKSVEDVYDFEKILGEYVGRLYMSLYTRIFWECFIVHCLRALNFIWNLFSYRRTNFVILFRGGYATVVLGKHLQTGNKFAIKIVDKRRAEQKQDQGLNYWNFYFPSVATNLLIYTL